MSQTIGRMDNPEQGTSLILTLIALLIVGAFSTALLTSLHQTRQRSVESEHRTVCLNLAEAGIDKALAELNRNPSYLGESGTELGAGRFSVEVAPDATAGVYQIVATAELTDEVAARSRVTARVQSTAGGAVQVLEWKEESVR